MKVAAASSAMSVQRRLLTQLSDGLRDDSAAVDRGPLVAPVVLEGEPTMVEAQQVQNRRVHVVHVARLVDDPHPDLIGRADGLAALDDASSTPHGDAPRILIAAGAFFVEG